MVEKWARSSYVIHYFCASCTGELRREIRNMSERNCSRSALAHFCGSSGELARESRDFRAQKWINPQHNWSHRPLLSEGQVKLGFWHSSWLTRGCNLDTRSVAKVGVGSGLSQRKYPTRAGHAKEIASLCFGEWIHYFLSEPDRAEPADRVT